MNAKSLRNLLAAVTIGLAGTAFAGYVLSTHDWLEDGWVLQEDRSVEIDEADPYPAVNSQSIGLPEIEFWSALR